MFPVCAGGARVKMSQADPAPRPPPGQHTRSNKGSKRRCGLGGGAASIEALPRGLVEQGRAGAASLCSDLQVPAAPLLSKQRRS